MKNLFFLSGLPRSGSTLLGSILSQHPKVQATPTSPLCDLICSIEETFLNLDIQYTYDKPSITENVYTALLNNYYNHLEKPYIIDKHRGWPSNVKSLKKFLGYKPKIIATNRRISEVISSYILLMEKSKQSNFIDNLLIEEGKELNNSNRADCLWRNYVSQPYESLVYGLINNPNNIHLIDYNVFVKDPEVELQKIYDFLEIESCKHNFSNIFNTCAEEKDHNWGIENLHRIRSQLQKVSPPPEEVIGEENTKLYDKLNI